MGGSDNVQLRQHLLASENDINTLSGFAASGRLHFGVNFRPAPQGQPMPMQQYPGGPMSPNPNYNAQGQAYSNHDLVTPVLESAGGVPNSRKASMTSSSMQRFFRRREDVPFDDETGADLGGISRTDMSFNDITHLRGSGRYGTAAYTSMDTAPIIPVVGPPGAGGTKSLNNVQYRKFMNHQKKLNLAQGARAMSLAGGNPMDKDPRTQSFTNPADRAMSLGNPMNGPRTQSLASSNSFRGAPGPGMSGPMGPNQARPRPPMGYMPQNGYMGHPPGIQGGMNPNYPQMYNQQGGPVMNMPPNQVPNMGMRPGNQFAYRGGPPSVRANSLNNNMGMYQPQMDGRTQSLTGMPGMHSNGPPNMHMAQNGHPHPYMEHSTDSLMNVVEEEEETEKPLPAIVTSESHDDDHVYKFEDGELGNQISRKSTIKKNNSMRVKKIDLFNKSASPEQPKFIASGRQSGHNLSDVDGLLDEESSPPNDTRGNGLNLVYKASSGSLDKLSMQTSNDLERNLKSRLIKLKSLTQNTAFKNFRSPSLNHSDQLETHEDDEDSNLNPTESLDYQLGALSQARSESILTSAEAHSIGKLHPTVGLDHPESDTAKSVLRNSSSSRELRDSLTSLKSKGVLSQDTSDVQDDRELIASRNTSLSRSTSMLKAQGILGQTSMFSKETSDIVDETKVDVEQTQRKSTPPSTSKSRNLFKRLSRSSSKKNVNEQVDDHSVGVKPVKPLSFTKSELAIMNCNNELQNELQLVTSELAQSIKRELAAESRNMTSDSPKLQSASHHDLMEKSQIIADLQDKLNKERKLRFISEEHALLAEHGQSPSPLKLNYEKNEIYNQLLVKNDLVIQLQDKLSDLNESLPTRLDSDMLDKFNKLMEENTELRAKVKRLEAQQAESCESSLSSCHDESGGEALNEYEQALIMSLRTQRDELREMITRLTASQNAELKMSQDRVKSLEAKLEKQLAINDKLTRRAEKTAAKESSLLLSGAGGKLQGLSIVSSEKKFRDDF